MTRIKTQDVTRAERDGEREGEVARAWLGRWRQEGGGGSVGSGSVGGGSAGAARVVARAVAHAVAVARVAMTAK